MAAAGPRQPEGSPLLYSYLKKYQEDPSSRVFAPLAEAYRKSGLTDEAIEIARDGLKIHPNFVGGRVALARALFDKKLYVEVIEELGAIVQDIPDNLVAQRLFAESSLMLGRVGDALAAFKMLLYFHPSDGETSKIVRELEAQAYEDGAMVLQTDAGPDQGIGDFQEKSAVGAIDSDPSRIKRDWVKKVELLQKMLIQVERYRLFHASRE